MGPNCYIGQIGLYAGVQYIPDGWMPCNGQVLQIAQYQALFAVIGFTYGPPGSTQFYLPDLRGRAPYHFVPRPGSYLNFNQGMTVGVESVMLNITQLPRHTHAAVVNTSALTAQTGQISASATTTSKLFVSDQDATHTTAAAGDSLGTTVVNGTRCQTYNTNAPNVELNSASVTSTTNVYLHDVDVLGTVAVQNGNAGGNPVAPHSNMQPSLPLVFAICYDGIYPARP
ncbi:MAG: tail fiber protein [Verrucomicrobiota bacterium JB022]|nr:tail fiber protein [Verrucomicrobiota bacterium JB022]